MILQIKKDKEFITEDFIKFLVRFLKRTIISCIDISRLGLFNEELKTLGIDSTAEHIILLGVANLKFVEFPDKYIIEIDQNAKENRTKIKIDSLCRLIDKGNIRIKPYPIFSTKMNQVRNNINKLFNLYCFFPV